MKEKRKGGSQMLDLLMLATLAVSCGLVYLLIRWCQKQVDSNE